MKITITWNADDANTNKDCALMGIRDELIKSAVDVIKTSLSSKRLKYTEVKHRDTTKGKKVIKLACNYSIDRINDLRFDVFYMLQRLAFMKHSTPYILVDRISCDKNDYPIQFKICIPRTKGFMNGYWYKICIE
jgi:hypothetical protein